MSELYHLAYLSKNTTCRNDEDIRNQIESILRSATKNNPARGITGALLFSGGYFCQVIEGPEEQIEELFEIIQLDARHADIKVLLFEKVQQRSFSDWSMAFAGIVDDSRLDIKGIKASTDELVMERAGEDLIGVMSEMVEAHQGLESKVEYLK